MPRSIYQYVVDELEKSDVEEVSRATNIPVSTLNKIRGRHIENPGIKSMELLYFHFRDREGRTLRRRTA